MGLNIGLRSVFAAGVPQRHKVLAKLLRALIYVNILSKTRILEEFEPYMIIYSVRRPSLGVVESSHFLLSSEERERIVDENTFFEILDKYEKSLKKAAYDFIVEATILWRGKILDKIAEGYITTRYRSPRTKVSGDIEIDIVNYEGEEDLILGDIIVRAFKDGIIDKLAIKVILEDTLYLYKKYEFYVSRRLKEDLVDYILAWTEKIVTISADILPLKYITHRYGFSIKNLGSLASDMRTLAYSYLRKEEEALKPLTGKELEYLSHAIDSIIPVILPYRLDYIKPIFMDAKDDIARKLEEEVEYASAGSLVAFDTKPLYKVVKITASVFHEVLEEKYRDVLEGSKRSWSVISKFMSH